MSRGKQYDLQKMLDLYNKGYSYQEIADEFQTKSVQSVRHAIEKRLKEDIAFDQALINFDKAETEKKKLKEEEESKKIEEKMKPVRMGIFDFWIDSLTLDALEYFLQNKYGSKVLIDKTNRVISMSEELDPEEMKSFLFNSGFLTLISSAKDDDMFQLNIEIFHSSPESTISMGRGIADLFFDASDYDEKNEVRIAVNDLIKSGRIKFDSVTLNIIDQNVNQNDVRKAIKLTGYSAKIFYLPTVVIEAKERIVVKAEENELVTIPKISHSAFESLIRDLWENQWQNLLETWLIYLAYSNGVIDAEKFYNDHSNEVVSRFYTEYPREKMELYGPYFEKTQEKIIADEYYFTKFNEISISEIEQMISRIAIMSSSSNVASRNGKSHNLK